MKEVVLNFKKFDLKIDESFFIFFLMKPLFLLFLYYSMYSRQEGLFGFSGGQTSVLISFGLFSLVLIHIFFVKGDLSLSNFTLFICLFFVFSGVLPLLSTFVFQTPPSRILRFSMEIGITFFMFFAVYYLIREKIITPKFFIYSFAILGFLASFQLVVTIFNQIRIMRLGGLSGLNYMGNSLAMAVFTWILIINQKGGEDYSKVKRFAFYFCMFITLLALLFTGTRAGYISLFVGLFLFQIFGMKSKNFYKYVFGALTVLTIIVVIIALNIDVSLLLRRFSMEEIYRMALIRFNIFARSVTDLTYLDFFFGRPDLYIFSGADDQHNTHNMFLSIIRYNGIFLFIMSIFLFVAIFYKYLAVYALHKDQEKYRIIESSTIVLLVMVMIYAMLSGGRITRSFSLFIAMGFAVGYFDLFRNLKSYEEYKELLF